MKNRQLMEELGCQLRLGVRTMSDETLLKLAVNNPNPIPKYRYLESRCAYDMLATIRYQERLLYINGTTPNSISHIISEY